MILVNGPSLTFTLQVHYSTRSAERCRGALSSRHRCSGKSGSSSLFLSRTWRCMLVCMARFPDCQNCWSGTYHLMIKFQSVRLRAETRPDTWISSLWQFMAVRNEQHERTVSSKEDLVRRGHSLRRRTAYTVFYTEYDFWRNPTIW